MSDTICLSTASSLHNAVTIAVNSYKRSGIAWVTPPSGFKHSLTAETLKMEAGSSSEISVNIYQQPQRHISEDLNVH